MTRHATDGLSFEELAQLKVKRLGTIPLKGGGGWRLVCATWPATRPDPQCPCGGNYSPVGPGVDAG